MSNLQFKEKRLYLGDLPAIRGRYNFDTLLAQHTWFQVGGLADVIVKPSDFEDLSFFIKHKSTELSLLPLGAGSNILIRDGGVKGAVLKLGREFAKIKINDDSVIVGAGCLDRTLVLECRNHGLSGLEFLVGIPGTVGGAVAMNAGAYGFEIKDFLLWTDVITPEGTTLRLTPSQLNMTYRHGNIPNGHIIIQAAFRCHHDTLENIQERIDKYLLMRENSQPIKGRTGGSTFKNPTHQKAWELIDASGCRGLKIGDAQVSEKHCNFLLNLGNATSHDLESLGELVRQRVHLKTGTNLEWEIIRSGEMISNNRECCMKNLRVAVLMGGWSGEREVSLSSGEGVVGALRKLGHDTYPIDVQKNLNQLLADIEAAKPDVIFNALHGVGGEDGIIQGVLEFLEIPYTHCGVTASAIGMDKLLSRQIFEMNGIPVPQYKMVSTHSLRSQNPFPFPYVIKPKAEGSSLGVYVIESDQDRVNAMEEWKFGDEVLIEEYIPGRDIFVAIINEKALGAIEVKSEATFYDYESKYTENKAIHICPPQMPEELYKQALEISEKSHHLLGCRGVTRTDLRYDDTTTPHRLVLLEINTQPGLTPLSLVPDVARSIGMSFEDLVQSMVLAAKCD